MNGKVIALLTDIVDIQFNANSLPQIGTVLQAESGALLSTEIIISDRVVRAVVLSQKANIALGEGVSSTGKPLQAPVGATILGRIFNVFGKPVDGKPMISNQPYESVTTIKSASSANGFIAKSERLYTGIKVIDFFLPIMKGDKLGMFGGAGVGKTLIIKEIINNITKNNAHANSLFVGIGERSREGEELYRELQESHLLNKVALIFAQMNETPGARMKVIYSALTMAEYFRDHDHQDTYMFIDNIYRYVQAGAEISSSLGRIPAQSGYQPTLASEISNVHERIANSVNGSITAFETVFVPADDITDPAVVAIFAHLDGSLVLDRKYAAEGKYPAISPLRSSSHNLTEKIVGVRHVAAVTAARHHLQRFDDLTDMIAVLGNEGIATVDQIIIHRARMIQNFFTQNFFVAELYTQRPGVSTPLIEVIEGVEKIVAGHFDNLEPRDFLYVDSLATLESKRSAILDATLTAEMALANQKPKKRGRKTSN